LRPRTATTGFGSRPTASHSRRSAFHLLQDILLRFAQPSAERNFPPPPFPTTTRALPLGARSEVGRMFRRVSLVWAVVCAALATGCGGGNEDKAPAAPRILSFTATPDLVDEGDEVVLAWETQNADSISIRIEGGETVELGDAAPAKGTVIVRPDGPTTYVLFAKGRGGSAESSASVAIKQPAGTLVASAEKVSWGESVELRWTTEHAEKIRLYRDDELLVQTEQPEGVHEDVPPLSGTYRLVVLRKEQQSESTLPIRVQPVVLRFEPGRAGPRPPGKPEPITWEVGGAREVELGTSAGEKVVVEVEPRASGTTPLVVRMAPSIWRPAAASSALGRPPRPPSSFRRSSGRLPSTPRS